MPNQLKTVKLNKTYPHPNNPRLMMREDVINTIQEQLEKTGVFEERHAPTVRDTNKGYEIVSGHHRVEAAKKAGFDEIPVWVADLSDEEAFYELVRSNAQGELSPLEIGIHALTAVPLSEGGRGKSGGLSEYAKGIGKAESSIRDYRDGAKVGQNFANVREVLDKTFHLRAISKAPESEWQYLTEQLLEHGWSVKTTELAVKAINEIAETECPDWAVDVINLDNWKKKAIDEVVNGEEKPRISRDYQNIVSNLVEQYNSLPEKREVKIVKNEDEYQVEYWNLKKRFLEQFKQIRFPSGKRIKECAQKTYDEVSKIDKKFEEWEAQKADEKERERQRQQKEQKRLQLENEYAPNGILGDVREILPTLEPKSFDLVLTDPPYLISNDGITCRGMKQTSVNKNFEDSKTGGIQLNEWLKLCEPLLKEHGTIVFTCTDYLKERLSQELEGTGLKTQETLIWLKRSAPVRLIPTGHRCCHEYIVVLHRENETITNFNYDYLVENYWKGKQPSGYLEFEQCSGNERKNWHDTQKPLSLWTYLLEAYSEKDMNVLDPFGGTATTAVACKQTRRKCTWVEIKEDFYQNAEKRVEDTEFNLGDNK